MSPIGEGRRIGAHVFVSDRHGRAVNNGLRNSENIDWLSSR